MDAYLQSLERCRSRRFHSVIVTGPLMPPQLRARLQAAAERCADVQLVTFTTDLMPSVRAAALVVSMAGYNTSVELLAARKRAIVIPRSVPREEQRLRASLLSKLGLVRCLEPQEDLVERLAELVPQALSAPPVDDELWASVDLRGAERVVEHLAQSLRRREPLLAAAQGVA